MAGVLPAEGVDLPASMFQDDDVPSPDSDEEAALAHDDTELLDDEDMCGPLAGLGVAETDDLDLPPASLAPPSPPAAPGPRLPASHVRFVEGGKLSVYSRRSIVECVCDNPSHGKCVLTRTLQPSRSVHKPEQGRPLGLCMAWLANGSVAPSKSAHWDLASWPTYSERVAGRMALRHIDEDFLSFERAKRDGETSEPEEAP
jgi:hypothetical protein